MNPFRNLIETSLLFQIIAKYDDLGIVALEILNQEDFTTVTSKSVFRSAIISKGDIKKTLKSIKEDYPDTVAVAFSTRLEIMQKDSGSIQLPDIDLDEVVGILRRNDDLEIINYCLDNGLYVGERGQNGHPSEVPGVRD
jgi:hypothetical protein